MSKVNVSLPEDLLERIDKLRQERRITRSEFLQRASHTYLEILEEERKEEEKRRGIKEAIRLQDKIRKKIGHWDSTAELRRFREQRK